MCFVVPVRAADEPCLSGVGVGGKPGPYTFHVATGSQRGQLTCYICETGERPAVIVFARSMSDPLAPYAEQTHTVLATSLLPDDRRTFRFKITWTSKGENSKSGRAKAGAADPHAQEGN